MSSGVGSLINPGDCLPFDVALEDIQLIALLAGVLEQRLVQLIRSRRAVDLRLSLAEMTTHFL
jgi:hypothetical protein